MYNYDFNNLNDYDDINPNLGWNQIFRGNYKILSDINNYNNKFYIVESSGELINVDNLQNFQLITANESDSTDDPPSNPGYYIIDDELWRYSSQNEIIL